MSNYRRFAICILVLELCLIGIGNGIGMQIVSHNSNKEYLVEVSRAARELREGTAVNELDLSKYESLSDVSIFDPDKICNEEYRVEDVRGTLYRFCYRQKDDNRMLFLMNGVFALIWFSSAVLLYLLGKKIIAPFGAMEHMTTELAKGNLSVPIQEEKSKFFGRFLWGLDLLREKLEHDRLHELELEKEKKTLVLSLSHDVRTPLSAIDLYAKALATDLYEREEERQQAILGIQKNAKEIQNYVDEIAQAAREDFLKLEVRTGEFYLSELLQSLMRYYGEKLRQLHTEFEVTEWKNCLLYGDGDRAVEVGQNLLENAIKYGDGQYIQIQCTEEEDHILMSVVNSGCSIEEEEIAHIFDSFYRGSNSERVRGSGLGLCICRELLHKMDGEIYARRRQDRFVVTAVFRKM